jgi:hypothetical protein
LLAHEHFRLPAEGARPTFALDMTNEEREIMARRAEHWRPWVDSGQMVIFGPVLDASGSSGLGAAACRKCTASRGISQTIHVQVCTRHGVWLSGGGQPHLDFTGDPASAGLPGLAGPAADQERH